MNPTGSPASTPRVDGFRMPGEFEPHAGCWMIFPERPDNWGIDPRPSQQVFADVAAAIARFEPVTMCVSARAMGAARSMLPASVRIEVMESNDSWMRDCGPTFLVDDRGKVAGVDWEFNAWGGLEEGLYHPWDDDNRVAGQVLDLVGARRYRTDLVNEGGAIHVDGEGTLITTRSVLLNPNRNPGRSQQDVERVFHDYLGIDRTIWLDVEAEDETDGHVDGLCAYVRPGTVMIAWHGDPHSAEMETCRAVFDQLAATTDARGRQLEILKLPLADLPPLTAAEAGEIAPKDGTYPRRAGDYVWGGYINFYIANGGVVYPCFGIAQDEEAGRILRQAFPDREVVGVPGCRAISIRGGIIHCITQQQPASP